MLHYMALHYNVTGYDSDTSQSGDSPKVRYRHKMPQERDLRMLRYIMLHDVTWRYITTLQVTTVTPVSLGTLPGYGTATRCLRRETSDCYVTWRYMMLRNVTWCYTATLQVTTVTPVSLETLPGYGTATRCPRRETPVQKGRSLERSSL